MQTPPTPPTPPTAPTVAQTAAPTPPAPPTPEAVVAPPSNFPPTTSKATPQPSGPNTTPPTPISQKTEVWTDEDKAKKLKVIKAIEDEKVLPNFNSLFTRYVLNSPPPDSDIRVDNVPGSGEVTHIPLNILQLTADEIFCGNWSQVSVSFTPTEKRKNQNIIPVTLCSLVIEVVYPITGTVRQFVGASDSTMAQNTAGESLVSAALKNALTKIGRRFGNRHIYAKLDRGYENEAPSRTDELLAPKTVTPPQTPPAK